MYFVIFFLFCEQPSTVTSHVLLLKSYTLELCFRWRYIWLGGPRTYLDLHLFSLILKHEDLTQRHILLLPAESCLWLDKLVLWAGQNQRQNVSIEHLRCHLVLACVNFVISVITDLIDMNINNQRDLYEVILGSQFSFVFESCFLPFFFLLLRTGLTSDLEHKKNTAEEEEKKKWITSAVITASSHAEINWVWIRSGRVCVYVCAQWSLGRSGLLWPTLCVTEDAIAK